ncbi:Na/Pi cotransporter family protein [Proteiniclasticum sp. QWL-01]|uniref:Na/Pi cotransporter family protein n=1 Tax=Proteiniclasticum sp. QWL-01 TaxID=3036945 RepID=UPI002410E469|nr:Na/Pi cotransporter family protein [Proteiniclasticum sp. QWL-01]WFF73327.1 Na/Pi cotransporter family protein [Proteiniclasticum sp. QWL-01]
MKLSLELLNLFGSVALFLFGVKLLGEGLESVARGKLRELIGRLTQNPMGAFAVGLFLTLVLQFSSATVILAMGLVNSGIITLAQAAGIVLGANLATPLKNHILVFDTSFFMPVFFLIGAYLYIFAKEKKKRDLALIFLGLGIVLAGLRFLELSISVPEFAHDLEGITASLGDNWFFALLLGIGLTVLLQSSSATLAILIMLAANGSISLSASFPIILGANLGTTSTALLSSIGAQRDGKRVALLHFLFNLTGVLVLLPLSGVLIDLSARFSNGSQPLQIANLHLLFNLAMVLVVSPLIRPLIRLTDILPGRRQDVEVTTSPLLDSRMITSPTIAEEQVIQQTLRMADYARKNIRMAVDAFLQKDDRDFDEIQGNEDYINYLEIQITSFLVKLSAAEPTESGQGRLTSIHHVIADLEKIGDLAKSIQLLAKERVDKQEEISEEAGQEIVNLYQYVIEAINVAIDSFRYGDKNLASTVYDLERQIGRLEGTYRDQHIIRLNRGKCTTTSGILFLDVISHLKRVGNHCVNICEVTLKSRHLP